ncbi:MAG: zinc-binding dehydrogenase [Deltaproteobacteria bacterium]|nr:zinc-binding dehydrogenase [Deltaproteobacteria bacterium]
MQAVIIEHSGRPEEVLAVRDIPSPSPGPDQVLIEVSARTIQPADFMFIEGRYRVKPGPSQVAGIEGVGTVIACGAGVTGIDIGTRVAFRCPGGAWAEYAAAAASRIYPVPARVPDETACQFPVNCLAAWALLAECHLPESSRLLITAGRSTVARLLTELARRRGLHAVLLAREGSGYAVLDGRDGRVGAKQATLAEALQNATRHGLFHAILDPVGGSATLALMDVLESGGRLISYGVLDDGEISLKASRLIYRNLIWQGFGIDDWLNKTSREQLEIAQHELWQMLAENTDMLPIIGRFKLSQVQEAIRTVRGMHRSGKVLLTD